MMIFYPAEHVPPDNSLLNGELMEQLNLYDENSNTNGRAGALSEAKSASLPMVEGLATSPYGNTGGNYTGIVNDESKPLSPDMLSLQGDGDYDSYRYWRCPSEGTDEDYELVYRHIPACNVINPKAGGVDWLNFVFRIKNTKFNVERLDRDLREVLGIGIWKEQSRRMHHYDQTYLLEDQKTLFMIGGAYQRDTAMISISGSALQYMDLQKVKLLGEEKLEAWITRVDLFKDFFDGKYNVDRAMEDYNNGFFKSDFGGRQPKDNLIGPTNPEAKAGRTYYIGDRKNGKVIRIYEKGKKEGIFEGIRSKWARVELELHGSNPDSKSGKLIPWGVLDRPGSYLAGSCKALAFTSDTHDRIKTLSVKMVSSLEQSVKHAKRMFGRLINVLHDMGYSPLQIQNLLIRADFPDWYEKKAFVRLGDEEEILSMCRDVFGEEADWGGVPDLSQD